MERKQQDFKQGKIYRIKSDKTDKTYVGSTCQSLSKRLSYHKNGFITFKNGYKRYNTSFDILEYDDYYIELIEEFPCNNRQQLERREGELIKLEPNAVNKIIVGRTNKEYYEDNKIIISQKSKIYREANKEKLSQKSAEYRQNNREKILEKNHERYKQNREEMLKKQNIYRNSIPEIIKERKKIYHQNNKEKIKERQKIYRQNNKEKIKEKKKFYHQNNKEKIVAKRKELYTCAVCGSSLTTVNKLRHEKSKKHQDALKSVENYE